MNYSNLIDEIKGRYNPDKNTLVEQRSFSGMYGIDKDIAKYVWMAMSAVDDEYTKITKQAGENVKSYLSLYQSNVTYKYQGSVMTNTHIKGYSDIDLLTICNKFSGTEIWKVRQKLNDSTISYVEKRQLMQFNDNFCPYTGDILQDMRDLRRNNEQLLRKRYVQCDTKKSKSIRITNQDLHRDVDIVTASDFCSLQYVLHGSDDTFSGIRIYDKDDDNIGNVDYPFLRISFINQRSSDTQGRLKRMIRFLKNVRAKSNATINLTSFEINSICYSIDPAIYKSMHYLELVIILYWQINRICSNSSIADSIMSVDGSEFVFKNNKEKINNLRLLGNEVLDIAKDLIDNKLVEI